MGNPPLSDPSPVDSSGEPSFFSRQITQARRFYLQLNPPWKQPPVIVCGGNEHCARDYHVQRSTFPYTSIEFVARGEGSLQLGDEHHPLMAGMIFAYGPGMPHDIRTNPDKPLVKYFATVAGAPAKKCFLPALRSGEVIQSSALEHLVRLFEDLIDAGRHESPYRPRICQTIMQHLLLRIAETAVPPGTIGTYAFGSFHRCREWIDANYLKLQSLSEVAAHCSLDQTYICRLFQRFAHQTPWRYVQNLKMRDAAHRLETQGLLVRQVAAEFGFRDPFQFSRAFRRVMGVSPRQFVKSQRRHS